MKGNRKLIAFGGGLFALVVGLPLCHDAGTYAAFAGAVVAVAGLFFKANVDVHKAQGSGA